MKTLYVKTCPVVITWNNGSAQRRKVRDASFELSDEDAVIVLAAYPEMVADIPYVTTKKIRTTLVASSSDEKD